MEKLLMSFIFVFILFFVFKYLNGKSYSKGYSEGFDSGLKQKVITSFMKKGNQNKEEDDGSKE